MINWSELTLFLYIVARMSGFVLFNPFFGRSNFPAIVRGGFIMVLSVFTLPLTQQTVTMPATMLEFAVLALLEMLIGFLLGMVVQFFLYIPQLAGIVVDTQMGMTMNQVYDSGSHANMSVTGILLNALMVLLFFAGNGHHTMLRIILDSGSGVPYGGVSFDLELLTESMLMLFTDCTVLAVKLCLPILTAELIGQLGMGILMKVIPQINVFAINIELKVIIGLVLLLLLVTPFSEFFLQLESSMLLRMQQVLETLG